jgi:hypothetical protein
MVLGIGFAFTACPLSSSSYGMAEFPDGCVYISVTTADLTCAADKDCALTRSGEVCVSPCGCGANTAVNTAAATRFASETAALQIVEDGGCGPCEAPVVSVCRDGQCVTCGVGENDCRDAGTTKADASAGAADGGASNHDGG